MDVKFLDGSVFKIESKLIFGFPHTRDSRMDRVATWYKGQPWPKPHHIRNPRE